jgi:1,4-dihydroxy-2-naphthoyl-CoA hydrolase
VTFVYPRTVHFQDTDAAGVVYFANVLTMCHEAYEASLAASGIELRSFFGGSELAIPIVHASVDFLKSMFCGDRLQVHLTAHRLHPAEFEVQYQLFLDSERRKPLSRAITRHVCIEVATRSRHSLPEFMLTWLASCGTAQPVTPVPVAD